MPNSSLPAPDDAIKLPVAERAHRLLEYIASQSGRFVGRKSTIRAEQREHWGRDTIFVNDPKQTSTPAANQEDYGYAISEAFDWLYIEGLITKHYAPDENHKNDEWFVATDRGKQHLRRGTKALDAHNAEKLLSFRLHPAIDGKIRSQFLLGQTEAAVMIAMKEVEIRMRDRSGLVDQDGVDLAGLAFKPAKNNQPAGPLADAKAKPGEQEGTASLFRGAMGTFRNPVVHRRVDYDDPLEAVEVIMFADLLLRMIDRAA